MHYYIKFSLIVKHFFIKNIPFDIPLPPYGGQQKRRVMNARLFS